MLALTGKLPLTIAVLLHMARLSSLLPFKMLLCSSLKNDIRSEIDTKVEILYKQLSRLNNTKLFFDLLLCW
jgi:hypothetical protein